MALIEKYDSNLKDINLYLISIAKNDDKLVIKNSKNNYSEEEIEMFFFRSNDFYNLFFYWRELENFE